MQTVSRIAWANVCCFNFLETNSRTLFSHLSNVNGTLDVSGAPRHVPKNFVEVRGSHERNKSTLDTGIRRGGETIVSSNARLLLG